MTAYLEAIFLVFVVQICDAFVKVKRINQVYIVKNSNTC